MVGIKSIILIISLGSYLVAFVNACIGDYEQGCVINEHDTTSKCCNEDSGSGCDRIDLGPYACIIACVDNDGCPEDYSVCAYEMCMRPCSTDSDCGTKWSCGTYWDYEEKVCLPCWDTAGGECLSNDTCCNGLYCNGYISERYPGTCQVLCGEVDDECTSNETCCSGLMCLGTDVTESSPGTCQVPCGIAGEDCTSNDTCCDGYYCNGTDISESTPGTCQEVPCGTAGDNCTTSEPCCDGLICTGTDISESNPGTCQVSCGTTGDNCTVNPDTCCDDYHCNGTNISESNPGTCQKKNKGFSLFDMSFSLKHLVGIAVVMVATWFL